MLDSNIVSACKRHAQRLGVPAAHLLAFVEVESAGDAFIPGTNFPVIRWEGHYFWRRLKDHGDALQEAERRGLAAPAAGAVPNPRDQQERYDTLREARRLCEKYDLPVDLAYECISMGLGQVMGANWRDLGYRSATDMLDCAQDSVDAQVEMMVRYLEAHRLIDALREGDWTTLAREYNGPAYEKHDYDGKLARAARKHGASEPTGYPTLRMGSTGPFVTVLQNRLAELGYSPGGKDGRFGSMTRAAVLAFQADHELATDGVAGPRTWRVMEKSPGRVLDPRRKEATVDDLRREGSNTIKSADAGTLGGVALGGAGAAGTVVEHLDTAERGVGVLERVQRALWPFWDTLQEFLPIIAVVVGGLIVWQMYRIKRARVEDHRAGRNLGR